MHAFVAVLSLAHSDRGQAFGELLEMFKDAGLAIPRRAEKLTVHTGVVLAPIELHQLHIS